MRAELLDIVFDGRNKAYGAYMLRKEYNKRVVKSLLVTGVLCLLFFWGNVLAHNLKKQEHIVLEGPTILLTDPPLVDVPKPETPPLAPPKQQQVQVNIKQFVKTLIVPDQLVEETPPDVETLEHAAIGFKTQAGIDGGDSISAPVVNNPKGTGTTSELGNVKKGDDEGKFISVQMAAEFPGGTQAWSKFLERNLNQDIPTEAGAPAGKYTVLVSFIVDASGNVSNVVAENDPMYGTANEAVRVIKRGPPWKPAIQNGRTVAYRVRQAITFVVSE